MSRHFAAELIIALEYLRNCQIIHRDLKPGNILLDENYHLKLIDFQTSKVLNTDIASKIPKKKSKALDDTTTGCENKDNAESRNYSLVGTEEYVSPEIL